MKLSDILSIERIVVDREGQFVHDKTEALHLLAHLLSPAVGLDEYRVEDSLVERERLLSTAIGFGVAIPHSRIESESPQVAALLLCPRGLPFESSSGEPVTIIFAVVTPAGATREYLQALAGVARLLQTEDNRHRLAAAEDPAAVLRLIESQEAAA